MVKTTALLNTAAIANRDHGTNASAVRTQAALMRLSKMTSGMIDVQANAMRVHSELLSIGVETGMVEEPTCPDNAIGSSPLQAVA